MGGADFIQILFSEFLNFDPRDPHWRHRDRFFLDPGHMSPMLYATLSMYGFFSMDDLKAFRQWGSHTPGHPEADVARGIENTSGPLGQGHTMAVGAAIAERFLTERFGEWSAHDIYAFISDGGIQEEVSQGAGRIAGYLKLHNLIMFYDANDIQLSTPVGDTTQEDTAKKYEAWGWKVITIDGHDHDAIRSALKEAKEEKEKPTLIIGKTIMGKGCRDEKGDPMEGITSIHGQPISNAGADTANTYKKLGADPENPFTLFPEVQSLCERVMEEKISTATRKKAQEKTWADTNPELAEQMDCFYADKAPELDYAAIEQKENIATRAASSAMLGLFATEVPNMIVASADLANSDKTDGFLKKSKAFAPGDFSGGFLHAGVSELTMACLMNGMALHGGVIPVGGTFFVFSDYMKPAIRLAALMELPVKYVWTHDAFRVGEDGPTHQPIEQEAQIRLLEQLKNHNGRNSMLVLRPADACETTVAWKMALENTHSPTGLILSRQNITDLPAVNGSRYAEALLAEKGAYVLRISDADPEIILVASGSEVSTLVAGAALLKKEGIKCRIVSAPSEGLFRIQDSAYQQEVIPPDLPVFGLTAGLPVTLRGLVGDKGRIWGLDHFGYSAPYTRLDEEFGFTPENVVQQVKDFLQS